MAKKVFLEFEHDIEALEKKIDDLRELDESEAGHAVSVASEIASLQAKEDELVKKIYAELTPWQCSLVARHPQRPYTLDYIDAIFTDFHELHGDRAFADDEAIVGGLARLADINVVVIGNQKGRTLKERSRRNFGMAKPEGYRKALRLMKLAEKFDLPVVTFVDTPGAYPGIDAEQRGQSEAIGRNLFEMAGLKVPVLTCIIGEGGSGGALALAVADMVMMLQYATYSVISPEGCASILWKSAEKASTAAPLGGAHRDPKLMATSLRQVLIDELRALLKLPLNTLMERRSERLRRMGDFEVVGEPATADKSDEVEDAHEVNAAK